MERACANTGPGLRQPAREGADWVEVWPANGGKSNTPSACTMSPESGIFAPCSVTSW